MLSSVSIVGHAIVSADGMIATKDGTMPKSLIVDADQADFQTALDESVLVVLGRLGHERHPNPGRRRLVLTSQVPHLQQDADDAKVTYWNPAGLNFETALQTLEIGEGAIAVTGGQRAFDLFLPVFTYFHLTQVHNVRMADGLSCFSQGQPQEMLARHGLSPAQAVELVQPDLVTKTIWRRAA